MLLAVDSLLFGLAGDSGGEGVALTASSGASSIIVSVLCEPIFMLRAFASSRPLRATDL